MTVTVRQSQKTLTGLGPELSDSLFPAFSEQTYKICRRLQSLQIPPATSMASQPVASDKGSLEERLFEGVARSMKLMASVSMHLDTKWRERLFAQINSLHDPDEWELGDEPLHPESFGAFLKAMVQIKPKRRPGLGLSSTGHLVAAWITGRDRLTIEFLDEGAVRWVLTRYVDNEPERFAGQTGVSRLCDGLAPYNPDHWFSDESTAK